MRIINQKTVVAAVALVALSTSLLAGCSGTPQTTSSANGSKDKVTAKLVSTECASTWSMGVSDYDQNRWFSDGIQEIRDATTPKEARKASQVWLDGVRKDPNLLKGAALYFLGTPVDLAALSEDGCATDSAVQLSIQLDLLFASSTIVPSQAPAGGYNSSVENGTVIGSETSGIDGNRKSILITTPTGAEIWIMARCGNVVTPGPPPHPPVHECLWPKPHGTWPLCKDDPTADPEPQGNNLPGGGGQAPAQTDPQGPPAAGNPPTVYTAPAPPAAVPTTPPVVDTTPSSAPPPTVDPASQPVNNGNAPATGSGPTCNPEFQSC